jgi:hypothetical protein
MKGRLSPAITILSSICLGFLLGIIFSKMVYNNLDLLTFEKFVFEIRLGLIFAAISGLGASFIESLIWFVTRGSPKYIIQSVNEE